MKRICSVLLTALLLALCFAPASAAVAGSVVTPVVVVSGMGSFPLYDGEIKEENRVWGPQTQKILKAVGKSLLPFAKAALKGDWDGFADETFAMVYEELFKIVSCDAEGEPLYDISFPVFDQSVDHYPDEIMHSSESEDEVAILRSMADAVGAENVYFFNYDWRRSPQEHAEDLHAFLENVKAEHSAKKVTLIPCSMGGTVVDSYLRAYGSGGIRKIINCLVASKGIDMVGELFCGKVKFQTDVLMERLFNFENGNLFTELLLAALKTVTDASPLLTKGVDKLAKALVEATADRAYTDIFSRSLATMPGMWAFVPDPYYESAKQTMFPQGGNRAFLQKIDDYHYNVQNKAETLLETAMTAGTDVYVTASYGLVGVPATDAAFTQGDCLIETHNESFGAAVAPYGRTLGKGYTAKGTVCADETHRHLSSDGIVDASTCAFPEQTWFIKHMKHVGFPYGSEAAELLVWLTTANERLNVRTDERYEQFTDLHVFTGKLTSLTGGAVTADKTDAVSNVFTRAVKLYRDLRELIEEKISALTTKIGGIIHA